jgi:chromosome segregation ATPase
MTYVRRRTTRAGTVSTALVESYRDPQGRPRQRLLANLHGEPDTLRALAKLAAQRDALRKERESLAAEAVHANKFYEIVTQNTLYGHQYSDDEREEIDRLMRQRERLLNRLSQIERQLATIQRDGAVIKKHCTATPGEIQAAIKAHQQERHDADCLVLGLEWGLKQQLKEAKATLRGLNI